MSSCALFFTVRSPDHRDMPPDIRVHSNVGSRLFRRLPHRWRPRELACPASAPNRNRLILSPAKPPPDNHPRPHLTSGSLSSSAGRDANFDSSAVVRGALARPLRGAARATSKCQGGGHGRSSPHPDELVQVSSVALCMFRGFLSKSPKHMSHCADE